MVGNTTMTKFPYHVDGTIDSVMYTPDSSCKKQQTSFSYISSDRTAKDPLQVVIKVQNLEFFFYFLCSRIISDFFVTKLYNIEEFFVLLNTLSKNTL